MTENTQYGGFWVRLIALMLDWAVVFVILIAALASMATVAASAGMEQLMDLAAWLVATSLPFLYWPVLESSPWQATVGKRVMGLQVTDFDGQRLSFMRALLRAFAKILSSIPLGVGYLLAAFTARKQALHDIIARTLVVRSGPSHFWKLILALILGFLLMVASGVGLVHYFIQPMYRKNVDDTIRVMAVRHNTGLAAAAKSRGRTA
jgi:uncharacterized RDD family membrane protein YckC